MGKLVGAAVLCLDVLSSTQALGNFLLSSDLIIQPVLSFCCSLLIVPSEPFWRVSPSSYVVFPCPFSELCFLSFFMFQPFLSSIIVF